MFHRLASEYRLREWRVQARCRDAKRPARARAAFRPRGIEFPPRVHPILIGFVHQGRRRAGRGRRNFRKIYARVCVEADMRFQLFVITGALGLASLLAMVLGADGVSDVAGYAAWGLIPVFWLVRVLARKRRNSCNDY